MCCTALNYTLLFTVWYSTLLHFTVHTCEISTSMIWANQNHSPIMDIYVWANVRGRWNQGQGGLIKLKLFFNVYGCLVSGDTHWERMFSHSRFWVSDNRKRKKTVEHKCVSGREDSSRWPNCGAAYCSNMGYEKAPIQQSNSYASLRCVWGLYSPLFSLSGSHCPQVDSHQQLYINK